MNATHSRAKAGGEYGANGEWYEGGKFINTVPENAKRQKATKRFTGKQQYENYKWAVAPVEGHRAIFPMLAGFEMPIREGREIVGFRFNTDLRGEWTLPEVVAKREAMIAAYNSGQRWME